MEATAASPVFIKFVSLLFFSVAGNSFRHTGDSVDAGSATQARSPPRPPRAAEARAAEARAAEARAAEAGGRGGHMSLLLPTAPSAS